MTPKQLAELEVWLAAGFDLPTALAAVGPDQDDESDESDEANDPPEANKSPPQLSVGQYLVCVLFVGALLILMLCVLG